MATDTLNMNTVRTCIQASCMNNTFSSQKCKDKSRTDSRFVTLAV